MRIFASILLSLLFTGGQEVSEISKLRLRVKILEAERIELQIRSLTDKRNELVKDINVQIKNLYDEQKLDINEYDLDLETITFHKKEHESK